MILTVRVSSECERISHSIMSDLYSDAGVVLYTSPGHYSTEFEYWTESIDRVAGIVLTGAQIGRVLRVEYVPPNIHHENSFRYLSPNRITTHKE